jgi:dipeptidyl-peptidase-4
MDSAKAVMRLSYGAEGARTGHDVCNVAAEPDFVPNVRFVRLGERKLFTAIVAPSASIAGTPAPPSCRCL